jgi:hypothetical protein
VVPPPPGPPSVWQDSVTLPVLPVEKLTVPLPPGGLQLPLTRTLLVCPLRSVPPPEALSPLDAPVTDQVTVPPTARTGRVQEPTAKVPAEGFLVVGLGWEEWVVGLRVVRAGVGVAEVVVGVGVGVSLCVGVGESSGSSESGGEDGSRTDADAPLDGSCAFVPPLEEPDIT